MQAIVLEQFGGVEHLHARELPLPEPGPGQLRVRIRAISVNPVDWKMRQGRAGLALPLVLGRDFAGTVHAVGPGAGGFQVGEAVYGALLGPRSNGSYAQYACAPAAFLGPKPATLSFAQAAALPVAALTAYECLVLKAHLRAGEALFIAGGSGGVGSLAIPLARRLGAGAILTTAGSPESADFLTRALGVEPRHILRYAGLGLEQMRERVLAMHGGQPLPVALDLVGGAMKRLCCQVLDFDGQMVTIVEEPPEFDLSVWSAQHSPLRAKSASLHLVALGARAQSPRPEAWSPYQEALASLSHWYGTGHLPPPPLTVLGALGEESIRAAHQRLEAGHVQGKLVLTVD